MLIINADDWGRNRTATDNSMSCFKRDRITSASAMVFMDDSRRAAQLALENGLDTGLHLNFTQEFDGICKPGNLLERQQRIASYLRKNKYSFLFYNPLLKGDFNYVYAAQYEEYVNLYNRTPTHIDGHHHLHLCTNMLADRIIPRGTKVRRSFTFAPGEKNIFNRLYRRAVDTVVTRRYKCTDSFFSLASLLHGGGLQAAADRRINGPSRENRGI
jgi:predicted glycoside hydrolase/deacetylase ChbG (UPF0249 family)